jgi:transcription initiation factor TFIID subunit 5
MGRAAADAHCQVIEYLSKKGYTRTEAMLRTESANQDAEGRPIAKRLEDSGGAKYGRALGKGRSCQC